LIDAACAFVIDTYLSEDIITLVGKKIKMPILSNVFSLRSDGN